MQMILIALVLSGVLTQEPKAVDPAAEAAWRSVIAATTIPGERKPISAFELRAEVLTRQGIQSNQFDATYRFLSPHYIRFGLGVSRETGRGPGKGQNAYWLKDKDAVTVLSGREYKQDRDLVRRMTTLAQNVLVLSDPRKIRANKLELREAAPKFLPKRLSGQSRLLWVEFVSPDFDLYRSEPPEQVEGDPERSFRVLIGADRESHLPRFVVLREELRPGTKLASVGEPLLFDLKDYRAINSYLLPHTILVRGYDPRTIPAAFQEQPGQEIYVTFANFAPDLKEGDFKP